MIAVFYQTLEQVAKMKMSLSKSTIPLIILLVIMLAPGLALAKKTKLRGTADHVIPDWFKVTFLDIKDDIKEAKKENKRLFIYFGQDGCPYCAALFNNNFSQKHIREYTQKNFHALAINMWGDREVTAVDGKTFTEKTFSKHMQVWFTPTIVFYDENGKIALRLNGYLPPHKFLAALKYVAGKHEKKMNFAQYMAKHGGKPSSGKLHQQAYFLKPPYNFSKMNKGKPLMVLFEQKDCSPCDHLHGHILKHKWTKPLINKYRIARFDMWEKTPLVTPDGKSTNAKDWARKLNISYAPSAVFFVNGKEVMRIEALLKSFHVQSVMDYVQSGAYKKEPSFQRYISKRADHLREKGKIVDIWK